MKLSPNARCRSSEDTSWANIVELGPHMPEPAIAPMLQMMNASRSE